MIERGLFLWLLIVVVFAAGGCAESERATRSSADESTRRTPDAWQSPARVLRTQPEVASIQLYRGEKETALPVLPMREGEALALEFDLLEQVGRPLSIYFYHADRDWNRDLVPAEYMASFHRDELLNYSMSVRTQTRYSHYRYDFPNGVIDFKLSGNYILRVSEQGREDAVLLERAFYVTERQTSAELTLDQVLAGQSAFPSQQPILQFSPPANASLNAFDYGVCFLRDGNLETTRCSDRPSLGSQPTLLFYLEPEDSFYPEPPPHFLDLSDIKIGGQIERTDLQVSPFLAVLEPDYIRFPGTLGAPAQYGQIVIRDAVFNVGDPSLGSEYVSVEFSLVPVDETPLPGEIYVLGSFNEWSRRQDGQMIWDPDAGAYRVRQLMKQGRYEYRYDFTDARAALASEGASPRTESLITALVYVKEFRLGTDRLIAAASLVGG